MTPREQLVAYIGAILAVAVPLVIAGLRLLMAKVALAQVEVEAAKAERLHAAARAAVFYAEETAERGNRAKVAADQVGEQFPDLDGDEIEVAVKSAVGEIPGIGESGKASKKNGVS